MAQAPTYGSPQAVQNKTAMLPPPPPQAHSSSPTSIDANLSEAFDNKGPYKKALDESYGRLAFKAVRLWKEKNHIRDSQTEQVFTACYRIGVTNRRCLMDVLCLGNLQLSKKNDIAVRRALDLVKKAPDGPLIYLWEMVNPNTKLAPSANQLEKVLRYAEDYVEKKNHDAAFLIDHYKHTSWQKARSQQGERAYMMDDKTKLWSNSHVERFDELKKAMRSVWANYSAVEMDLPMKQPMREVGYTANWTQRWKDHLSHSSTNYLMGLFDAICGVFEQQIGAKFTMAGEVIFKIWHPAQATSAESFFMTICRADTASGRGFSYENPGTLVLSPEDLKYNYEERTQWMLDHMPYFENVEADEKRRAELDEMRREIERRKKIVADLKKIQEIKAQIHNSTQAAITAANAAANTSQGEVLDGDEYKQRLEKAIAVRKGTVEGLMMLTEAHDTDERLTAEEAVKVARSQE